MCAVATMLFGCAVAMLLGYAVAMFFGCAVAMFFGCAGAMFFGCAVAMFFGCAIAMFFGCATARGSLVSLRKDLRVNAARKDSMDSVLSLRKKRPVRRRVRTLDSATAISP